MEREGQGDKKSITCRWNAHRSALSGHFVNFFFLPQLLWSTSIIVKWIYRHQWWMKRVAGKEGIWKAAGRSFGRLNGRNLTSLNFSCSAVNLFDFAFQSSLACGHQSGSPPSLGVKGQGVCWMHGHSASLPAFSSSSQPWPGEWARVNPATFNQRLMLAE